MTEHSNQSVRRGIKCHYCDKRFTGTGKYTDRLFHLVLHEEYQKKTLKKNGFTSVTV